MIIQLPVSIQEEDDFYVAFCPVFHVTSRGKSMKEAMDKIKQDLEKYLDDEEVQSKNQDILDDYSIRDIEIIEVVVHKK